MKLAPVAISPIKSGVLGPWLTEKTNWRSSLCDLPKGDGLLSVMATGGKYGQVELFFVLLLAPLQPRAQKPW